jgi:hypothetical protein
MPVGRKHGGQGQGEVAGGVLMHYGQLAALQCFPFIHFFMH